MDRFEKFLMFAVMAPVMLVLWGAALAGLFAIAVIVQWMAG